MDNWFIIHSPVVGSYSLVGPFSSEDAANVYAQTHHAKLESWHIVQATPPIK